MNTLNNLNGLTIDLSALADNWRGLASQLKTGVACGAVVKANAYGLGVKEVIKALLTVDCREFFVANLDEALYVRDLLPAGVSLYVLSGCQSGEEKQFLLQGIQPVIVSLAMFERWYKICRSLPDLNSASAIKINTGMNRYGMEAEELHHLFIDPDKLKMAGVNLLMSHLACADDPEHPLNEIQLQRFIRASEKIKQVLPACNLSLANSGGIFLGEKYQFDLVRPGIALYGGQPQIIQRGIKPVVHLNLPVLQTRQLKIGESVGYGAAKKFESERKLLVVGAGYADGIHRILGNSFDAFFMGHRIAQVGRISMDSIVLDVTELPTDKKPKEGDLIEILGQNITVNELAEKANTISYEVLTSLGHRYPRHYVN